MKLFNSLSKSATECDKQIMKYIENNTDSFVEEGIIKTAQKCFVSAPMITKFAKKYGYKGKTKQFRERCLNFLKT